MSWSAYYTGTPEKVIDALKNQSGTLSGQSKIEFDDVLPHLTGLIEQYKSDKPLLVRLAASGSGYAREGTQETRTIRVSLEQLDGVLL
jgi:hypothetical protein